MKLQRKNLYAPLFIAVLIFPIFIFPNPASADGPVINIWYGQHQVFGQPAMPQCWINILGNVSNPDDLASLTYSLNGGPERSLSIGPDTRRLAASGDFNIDIYYTELQPGHNEVVITAATRDNQQAIETVTLEYMPDHSGPQTYTIDWSATSNIQEVAQIVDGEWALEADGIRPTTLGYDRLVAVGDMWWDDYEVTVPVTIHGAEPVFGFPSNGAAVAVVARWQGHRVWDNSQPAYGWWPLGGAGVISWINKSKNKVLLAGNRVRPMAPASSNREIEYNVPYMLKLRVETIPGYTSLYSFKIWEANQPEPKAWAFQGQQRLWDPMFGSVLLVAHHTDVTFGNVSVTPIVRFPWKWFRWGSYAAQLPLLLICLIGIVLAIRYRTKHRAAARLVLIAAVLAAIGALGGTFSNIQLPLWLHRQGWNTYEIGLVLVANETIQSLIVAISLGLLIWAIFRWRQEENKNEASEP
jgi:hypothetical protein